MSSHSIARLTRAFAWPITAACVAMGAGTIAFSAATHTSLLDHFTPGALSFGVLFPVLGALIVSRRGNLSIGWIFITLGLSQVASTYFAEYATWVLVGHHVAPLAGFSAWLGTWVFAPGLGLFLTFALL